MRILSLPVTVLALALLVFVPVSSQAAFEVLVDSTGTNAYGIRDLPVTVIINEEEVTRFYDVTFRYEEAQDVYPNGALDFDFAGETNVVALQAVLDALDSETAVTTVGPADDDGHSTVFLPVVIVPYFRWYVNLWGDYQSSWLWVGTDIVKEDEKATYADFTELPTGCTEDDECDDHEYCNGEEACVDGECQDGTAPCIEGEICNEETNTCEPVPQPCECDLNNDGVCDMQDWLLFGEDWGRTDCPIQ